jgi:hypothetical protein
MKKISKILIALVILTGHIKADEGMWLLPLIEKLNIEKMNEMGFKLTAEDIFSINHSSLKDAVVIFGRGCTGELISDKGLILTNHHCGYGAIQSLSSMEHNYLDDGFWASTMDDEIPAPGLEVSFLKRIEDITEQVLEGVTKDMPYKERQKIINENRKNIVTEVRGDTKLRVLVQDFFAGNQYFLVVYEVFKDIRFVGAPPSSIGKFGHDTDNWMWPRHTCDFSIFRVYADADGNPAEFSNSNVPYKPQHHLPISLKGYQNGDFGMTIGYPGSTFRYLTSWGIEERVNISNNTMIKVRGVKQAIWAEAMNASDKVRLQYASKYSSSSNYWKNSIGMNRGIEALDVINKKQAIEKEFAQWAKKNPEYENVLSSLEKAYKDRADVYLKSNYLRESLIYGTEILRFASNAQKLMTNPESIETLEYLKEIATDFYKDYDATTDEKVLAAMLELLANDIGKNDFSWLYADIDKKYKNDYKKYAKELFSKSIFADENKFKTFLAKPDQKQLATDPAYKLGAMVTEMSSRYQQILDDSLNKVIADGNRLFIDGMIKMYADRVFYPDANFTMRISYGSIGDYEPRDAVFYKHYTTLKGVMEKEDPNNFEFIVPQRLKDLYKAKDYGRYAATDGDMYVCFTTNNDITGGNSGSPVINANGELFGIAFDGNWEAMSGDIAFEPDLQKCINVDIRYVLFIIDKYAGATRLIEEMTIVK